jgi:hypothetical protein
VLFLDRVAYFLITRAKTVVDYLKKFTNPRYVIAFVLIYPHIYTNLLTVVQAAQTLMINIADQFFSWIEASFWGIYSFIRDKLRGIWFGEAVAVAVAGIAMAFPFLAYIIFRYALVPIANALLTVALNVLGAVYYVFCRVVIPALKMAFGAYLFAKFMPASYKYIARALDRFAQGKFGGFVGALLGALAPFSMFFIGPLIISIVADPACRAAYVPPTIGLPYPIPYVAPTVYQFTLEPTMSWIIASMYGPYASQLLPVMSYISAYISWDIQRLTTFSYIIPSITFQIFATALPQTLSYIWPFITFTVYYIGAYPPYYPPYPYYPGAYLYPIPTFSYIYPTVTPGYLSATFSYVFTELPLSTPLIRDKSFIVEPPYGHVYIQDLSYIGMPPYITVLDYSYIGMPPYITVLDYSYIGMPPYITVLDYSYLIYRD